MRKTPGNISSNSRTLAAFTNPTRLALRKGNLKQDYPVNFRGEDYVDAEEAYQKNKHHFISSNRMYLMWHILIDKLSQHPGLVQDIKDSGGVSFLENCDHMVYGKSKWEGRGRQSEFIRCLIAAYKRVTGD